MAKINLLDFQVANLIAAGEVVDRPASVVKELLENAIDAGGTDLTVEIKRGGVSYIRVTDNGCGMEKEDALNCILRHATSKIKSADDLDGIVTLGFRGEALAAISAVSKMRIVTRVKSNENGTEVTVDAGNIVSASEISCRVGTTIVVEQLFANVPARRKFLKRDQSEGMAVSAVVEKIALSRPDIAIRFISDGQLKICTQGDGKLYGAVFAVLGKDFAGKLIEVKSMTDGIEVFGYIGSPVNVRSNRNSQNFFINGRYIRSRTATAALEQAYSSYMESEKFPVCVLNIVLHPASVDVNVHPTKLEVKFSNERAVFDAVYCAVRNAILSDVKRPEMLLDKKSIPHNAFDSYNRFTPVHDRMNDSSVQQQTIEAQHTLPIKTVKNDSMASVPQKPYDELSSVPDFSENEMGEEKFSAEVSKTSQVVCPMPTGDRVYTKIEKNLADIPFPEVEHNEDIIAEEKVNLKDDKPILNETVVALAKALLELAPDEAEVTSVQVEPEEENVPTNIPPEYKVLGIAFETYILVQCGETLLMIDKHAAHERIIFEDMKQNLKQGARYSQLLMLPVSLSLTAEEYASVLEYRSEIEKAGFQFYCEEGYVVNINEIPGGISEGEAVELFCQIATGLLEGTALVEISRETAFEKALYQASCKAAVKGGRKDGPEHLDYICKRLLSNPDIRYCPHGRPVAFELTKSGIEHQFKRS